MTSIPSSDAGGTPTKKTSSEQVGPRLRIPHIYVVLFLFSAIAAIATHLMPASRYDRVDLPSGREAIDPDTYSLVPSTPVGLVDFMTAIPRGLIAASDVVFFTFLIGGMFMVLRETGIIECLIDRLARLVSRRRLLVVPALMLTFSAIATLIGTQELALVYVPVILPLVIALRFDSITAAAIALCATTAGFTSGVLNPINTGLGQQIAGLEPFSGIPLRAALWACLTVVGIAYVSRYAHRVATNPASGLMAEEPNEISKRERYVHADTGTPMQLNKRQRIGAWVLLGFFAVLVWGVLDQGWFFIEMSGLFIAMGIVVGLISGLTPTRICEAFDSGMRDVLVGAIIVGVARSVAIVLEDGQVMDTLVHSLGEVVGLLPGWLAAVGMLVSQSLFNLVVPSGSGQALVTMPIMAPLSDLIGVTRQTAVLAYQLGDGLSNILYPTSGYFMATLALAGVRYDRWIRFFLPLFAFWFVIALTFCIIAQAIGWTG